MRKLQVLVLDDEPLVGERLKPLLERMGFEVEAFDDPSNACQRIHEKEFDIVISDLMMRGIDGIQVLEFVRERSLRTKVILVTGWVEMAVVRSATEKGAFDFLAKPFESWELRRVMARAAAELGVPLQMERESGSGG
jgi:DNA-binding NtrC family response regulator